MEAHNLNNFFVMTTIIHLKHEGGGDAKLTYSNVFLREEAPDKLCCL